MKVPSVSDAVTLDGKVYQTQAYTGLGLGLVMVRV